MALMCNRVSLNYAKKGYYPTDEETLTGILNRLKPANNKGTIRIIDPCCGEGNALAELQHHLSQAESDLTIDSFGIEVDKERAWYAKSTLDRVIHGNINDCWVGNRQFSAMLLNPPYGDLVADHLKNSKKFRSRLEKMFYQKTKGHLQFGGIGIIILPYYVLDPELSGWIATHYQQVQVYRAAVDTFKQVVILGQRCRSVTTDKTVQEHLEAIGQGDIQPKRISDSDVDEQKVFIVPESIKTKLKFMHIAIEPVQLLEEIKQNPTLWTDFDLIFSEAAVDKRQPLRRLSDWHMALMLASGHVSGLVTSKDGKKLLIKGDTHKVKKITTKVIEPNETDRDKEVQEIRTALDVFVPVIRGINFTPGPDYGNVVKII